MFAALCENTEFFRERMNGFVAISPVVGISNMKSDFFKKIARNEVIISTVDKNIPEILPWQIAGNSFTKFITKTGLVSFTTDKILELVSDSNPSQGICSNGYSNLQSFYPAGTSFQCVQHLKQLILTGEFKKRDMESPEKNIEKYGQPTPPHYDLSKIKDFPISLICGKNDMLSSPEDYHNLNSLLINNGNKVDFREYDVGHLGILCPKDEGVSDDIL